MGLLSGRTRVRDASVGDDLGEQNSKRPDVRLVCEAVVVCCLRSRPLDGEARSHPRLVFILLEKSPRSSQNRCAARKSGD